MDKVIDAIMDVIVDIISTIVDWVVSYFKEDLIIPFLNVCKETGDGIFSGFMTNSITVLQQSPAEWNSSAWEFIMTNVNTVFVAFGSQLVVLLFLISFFADSVEPQREIRLETFIKALFKILFAQYLVIKSAEIITTFFGFVGKLTCKVTSTSWLDPITGDYKLPAWGTTIKYAGRYITYDEYLDKIGSGYLILTVLFAFIYLIVMVGAGGVIAYTAYMRFFKIMLIVPYGAMVSSTVAGNQAMSNTAIHYYKYILGVVLEAVTMIVAIGLYTSIVTGTGLEVLKLNSPDSLMLCEFTNRALAVLLLVGAVKGAGALTQKVLGA